MLQSMQAPLFFGLIAAFVTTVALIAVAARGDWSERHSGLFALAAGGMLVTLSLLHITPEAFALSRHAPALILTGFLGGLMISFLIRVIFPESGEAGQAAAVTPVMAVALHSFIDGIIYSVTFAASFSSGVYAALSLLLHKFPEGIIAFAILRRHGISNRRAFLLAFLAAAVTTPLGVIASSPFMYGLGPEMVGNLFAISAGLLLYVATGPLMEPLKEEPPLRSFLALGAGVTIAVLIASLPVHGPDHSPHDGPWRVGDHIDERA
ncbi:ZIP family metal transporter [Hyphomonas sp.]|uniref:ZIP family metal transporter n=1 Tax=Hyphomonas sp. TaxID=87 RepID=UPI0032EFAD94